MKDHLLTELCFPIVYQSSCPYCLSTPAPPCKSKATTVSVEVTWGQARPNTPQLLRPELNIIPIPSTSSQWTWNKNELRFLVIAFSQLWLESSSSTIFSFHTTVETHNYSKHMKRFEMAYHNRFYILNKNVHALFAAGGGYVWVVMSHCNRAKAAPTCSALHL